MKLTPTQIGILEHRLSSDCIASCFADTEEMHVTEDEAQAAVDVVEKMVEAGELPLETLTPLQLEVVIDCLDGSTYFCDMDEYTREPGEAPVKGIFSITKSQARTAHKAADALEAAVSKAAGRRVLCVRC